LGCSAECELSRDDFCFAFSKNHKNRLGLDFQERQSSVRPALIWHAASQSRGVAENQVFSIRKKRRNKLTALLASLLCRHRRGLASRCGNTEQRN